MKLTGLFRKLQNLTQRYSHFALLSSRQSTDFTLEYRILIFINKLFCFEAFCVVAGQFVPQLLLDWYNWNYFLHFLATD